MEKGRFQKPRSTKSVHKRPRVRQRKVSKDRQGNSLRTKPQIPRAKKHKWTPVDLDPIRHELTNLWRSLEKSSPETERRRERERIKTLEGQYHWIEEQLPVKDRAGGVSYLRNYHGRIYRVDPRYGCVFIFHKFLDHFLSQDLDCNDSEGRDRFLCFLWRIRKFANISVSIPVSRGKLKTICFDCGLVHPQELRSQGEKLLGCPRCHSRKHRPIDPAAALPGSQKRFNPTQSEFCKRFRITQSRFKTILKKYSLPSDNA